LVERRKERKKEVLLKTREKKSPEGTVCKTDFGFLVFFYYYVVRDFHLFFGCVFLF